MPLDAAKGTWRESYDTDKAGPILRT